MRKFFTCAVVMSLGLFSADGLRSTPRVCADSTTPSREMRWEFASVGFGGVKIITPGRIYTGNDWPDLVAKYTGKEAPASGVPEMDAINALGHDGWELVAVTGATGQTWWFKRPVRP